MRRGSSCAKCLLCAARLPSCEGVVQPILQFGEGQTGELEEKVVEKTQVLQYLGLISFSYSMSCTFYTGSVNI